MDEINKQIELVKKQKQEVDSKMTGASELMKNLNLQASTRAKLNLKRTDKKKKEEDLQKM